MSLADLFRHAVETLACFYKRNAHIHNDVGYTAIAVINGWIMINHRCASPAVSKGSMFSDY